MRTNTDMQFPHTKTVTVKGNAKDVDTAALVAILAELRRQTAYMKRVDKLVSLFWAVLIGLLSLAVAAGVFWFVAEMMIQ